MLDSKPANLTFARKWGDDPFTALGYVQVPTALILYAVRLGLTPDEGWLIACILQFKHTHEHPYPSQARLAELLGRDERTVRRLVRSLAGKGMLRVERVRGGHGHYGHAAYDFAPLRAKLCACYEADRPQERPAGQIRPAEAHPPDKTARLHRADCAAPPDDPGKTAGHGCPANQNPARRTERKEPAPLALPAETEPPRTCAAALKLDAMTVPPSRFDADWMHRKLMPQNLRSLIDRDPRLRQALNRNWAKIPPRIQGEIGEIVSGEGEGPDAPSRASKIP